MKRRTLFACGLLVILLLAGTAEAGKAEAPGRLKKAAPEEPASAPEPAPTPAPQPAPAPAPAPEAPALAPDPQPAPQPAPVVLPAPQPVHAAPQPAAQPVGAASETLTKEQTTSAAPASPTPVPEKRTLRFDAGQVAAPVAPAFFAPTPAAPVDAESVAATEATAFDWTLPLAGVLGVGLVGASAIRFRAPRKPAVAAPAPPAPPVTMAAADVPSLLRAGKAAVERYDYAGAIGWFDQALALDPRIAVAHFCKGVCLAGLLRYDDAHAAFKAAYALDPNEGAIRLEFARSCARTGRHAESMAALGPLLEAMPALAPDVREDEAFASLKDHPRFLQMLGAL